MNLNSNRSGKIFIAAFLAATFIGCKRDGMIDNAATNIAASEKLSIPSAIDIPANLPNGNTRVATYYAKGVQKYKAQEKAGSSPLTWVWVFVAPQADLYDVTNRRVGSHGAGPFWEISTADSIFAQQYSPPKAAPSPDGGSIDWLLLSSKAGTTPTGIFSGVNYIQRLATRSGQAPATPPTHANQTVEIPYEAIYRFSKKNL
jgi:hypothetical protein